MLKNPLLVLQACAFVQYVVQFTRPYPSAEKLAYSIVAPTLLCETQKSPSRGEKGASCGDDDALSKLAGGSWQKETSPLRQETRGKGSCYAE